MFMFSMPPATMSSASPARIADAPSITAFRPEPQTLLMVMAPTLSGRPAFSAAWRAGAWPTPAWSTLPMIASSTCSGRSRPLDRGADGDRTQLGGRSGGEPAEELADGRTGGGEDVDVTHALWYSDQREDRTDRAPADSCS